VRIESGAGVFDVQIERAAAQADGLSLYGTVDEWDCTTRLESGEMARVFLMCIRPSALKVLIRGLVKNARARFGSRATKE